MKEILTLTFIVFMSLTTFSQDVTSPTYSYAYITVERKPFSKQLKVTVDLGDTPEQLKTGEKYSEELTNKESQVAILNYMGERQYELIETRNRDQNFTLQQGVGKTSEIRGSTAVIFIMRKKQLYKLER